VPKLPKAIEHLRNYTPQIHTNSEDSMGLNEPACLTPPRYVFRCQNRTGLSRARRSQASRFYSTSKSVLRNHCFQDYATYPSMGFDPLQGPEHFRRLGSFTDTPPPKGASVLNGYWP